MNAQQVRRNSDSVSSVDVSRFAALQKLRRLIFSPARRRVVAVVLAAVLTGSAAFAQSSENASIAFNPTADITVGEGDTLTVHNDEQDLKHEDNDASKTITLEGGTFSYQSNENAALGTSTESVKNWNWGEGGTIDVQGIAYTDGNGNEQIGSPVLQIWNGGIGGNNLTKTGNGELAIVDSDGGNITFGNLSIAGGYVSSFGGGVQFGYDTTSMSLNADTIFHSQLYGTGDNSLKDAIRIAENQTLEVSVDNDKSGNMGISSVFARGGDFNSEGKLVVQKGWLNVYTGNIEGETNQLELNLANLEIKSSGELDKKGICLYSGSYFDDEGCLIEDENVTINLEGKVLIDGGDEENQGQDNANLYAFGETVISGSVTNQNGGVAVFLGHVTLTGEYKSTSVNPGAGEGYVVVSDVFRGGLTIAENGWLESRDLGLTADGDLEIKGNGEALIYGESLTVKGVENATIRLSENGVLRGTCENIDATTIFDGETLGGTLLLGNFNKTAAEIYADPYFVTVSEDGDQTKIKMNSTGEVIRRLLDKTAENNGDYLHSSKISGAGTIEISTPVGYSVDEKAPTTYVALLTGDKTEFTGNTEVKIGSLGLYCSPEVDGYEYKKSFQYGSATKEGVFNVYGETKGTKIDGVVVDQGTDGQLVFWRPEQNCYKLQDGTLLGTATLADAPILYADQVNFLPGEIGKDEEGNDVLKAERGAKLFFSTCFAEYKGDELGFIYNQDGARNLGTISANEINFSSNNYVWYDKVSLLTSGATMTITLDAPTITIDGEQIDSSNKSELVGLFDKPLVSVEAAQIAETGGYTINANAKDVKTYMVEQSQSKKKSLSQKEIEYAAQIDQNRLAGKDTVLYDALYNENDPDKILQAVHNLSLGGFQMLNANVHYGNPTSSFFADSTISGEHKRAQSIDPDYDPLAEKYQQQSAINNDSSNDASRSIWAAYTNTSVDGKDYKDGDVTMLGYRLQRQDVIGGLRRQFDGTTSGGLFFGLSNPEITSNCAIEGGYGYYGSRMDMDDFQFAAHFEKIVGDFWEIAAYVGGGTQAMDWTRQVDLNDGGLYRFNSSGTGNTLTGTLYLANRIDLNDNTTFRPMIGVDSEHSWLFGFTEAKTAGGASTAADAYMRWLTESYSFAQTYYNRNRARAGARLNWSGPSGIAGINVQAFYAVKLGGKDAPILSYNSQNYSFNNMETHVMGNESFSAGGGGFVNLNQQKTLTATGDYNAVWYKNATTQNVTGGLSYRF